MKKNSTNLANHHRYKFRWTHVSRDNKNTRIKGYVKGFVSLPTDVCVRQQKRKNLNKCSPQQSCTYCLQLKDISNSRQQNYTLHRWRRVGVCYSFMMTMTMVMLQIPPPSFFVPLQLQHIFKLYFLSVNKIKMNFCSMQWSLLTARKMSLVFPFIVCLLFLFSFFHDGVRELLLMVLLLLFFLCYILFCTLASDYIIVFLTRWTYLHDNLEELKDVGFFT